VTERVDSRQSREQKLQDLAELGLPLLPDRYGPTRPSIEVKADYAALEGSTVSVAGRLMTIRLMGKAAFAHLQDAAGSIQLYFKRDVLGETAYQYFKLLDLGDIIGAEGTVFKTRTGEISIEVTNLVLLAKALRPLPDKYHGLTDVETRYRRRYLDLIANPEAREVFRIRSAVVAGMRRFLDARGFTEVETPILQPLYGGGVATPFTTQYEAIDTRVFLRIATELYLKRLIVGGMERVYEIGKDFRNENFSRKHSPEFTMLELYQAYANYNDIMDLTETMTAAVAREATGTTRVRYEGMDIDLTPPWKRLSIEDAVRDIAGIDLNEYPEADALRDVAVSRGVVVEPAAVWGKVVEEIVSTLVEPNLIQPTFLVDFPVDFPGSLLAKRKPDEPRFVQRFELYIGGMEFANGFTELNEPEDQRRRMEQAAGLRGEEFQYVDEDYLLAMEHGMPPNGGLGIGIDRLVMLLAGVHHIRETILFPLLRPTEHAVAES